MPPRRDGPPTDSPRPTSQRFGRVLRLTGRSGFAHVLKTGLRAKSPYLVLYLLPNHLPRTRLGISVGRPVGIAVKRNRIKRLVREAFRLRRADLPVGYDLVVVVRPHAPLELGRYQELLVDLASQGHRRWQDRQQR